MDVVVTVPKQGWRDWLAEGHCAEEPCIYEEGEYHYFGWGEAPTIVPGERVYIVAHGRVRGYAPLVRLARPAAREAGWWRGAHWALVRRGQARAVTIPDVVRGFRGWRYRWWDRGSEEAFRDWQTAGVPASQHLHAAGDFWDQVAAKLYRRIEGSV